MGIKDVFNNAVLSLTTKDEGFSFRKVISIIILGMTIFLHIKYANHDNVLSFLLYDFGFIAVLLGLLNLDRFVEAKWGSNKEEPKQEDPKVEQPKVDQPPIDVPDNP